MTTFRELQDEVLHTLQGYGLDQPRTAWLTATRSSSALTVPVDSTTSLAAGIAEIESEQVYIQSVDHNANTVTIAPDGRGWYGTTAAEHVANTRVTFSPTWPRQRVKSAINDTIVGTYPTLFGVAQTQFTYNPSVTTYSIPAEAERVLSVTADVNGPSLEQQNVRHYQFNSTSPTDDWATTNSLTLHEAVTPGRTVTVTYQKAPSALATDAAQLTTSGLRETAKLAIVYGTVSQLVSHMDTARLAVDTAQGDEYDERNQVGQASRISGQLYLRYQSELEAERRRLRATTPVAISVRKR